MNLLDIAIRAEKAEEPDREMFIAAWVDVFAPGGDMNIRNWPVGLGGQWIKFMRLLDEEAWLDAARVFVHPEHHEDWGIYRAGGSRGWEGYVADFTAVARDAALALFAAALRCRAEENTNG